MTSAKWDRKGGSLRTAGLIVTKSPLDLSICRNAAEGPPRLESDRHRWFAVRVKSNFERTTATHLEHRGFQMFLPAYTTQSRWSDRIKSIERPLFPGYVFCGFDPNRRLPVLSTPGVLGILGIGKEPLAVDENEIEAVWTSVKSGLRIGPLPYLEVGQRVVIERGPLSGVEGIVTRFRGAYRLAISVTLLHRSIFVEVEREWIRPSLQADKRLI